MQTMRQAIREFVTRCVQALKRRPTCARPIKLSTRDTALLVEALLNPPQPSEHLRAAFRRHQELIGTGNLTVADKDAGWPW